MAAGQKRRESSCGDSELQTVPAKHPLISEEKDFCLDSYSLEAKIKDLPQQI